MRFHNVLFFSVIIYQSCQKPSQFEQMPGSSTGIAFRNEIVETPAHNILTNDYIYNGAGVAVGDINNDGWSDIYFCGNSVDNKLFLNKGNWVFEDITAASKTKGKPGWKTGVTMADVNGDGFLDIYVCYSGNYENEGYNKPVIANHPKRANQLFINSGTSKGGTPVFTDQAKEFGLDLPGTFSNQAYFFDFDKDGDLDLLLLNHANTFYAPFENTRKLRSSRHPYFGNKLLENREGRFIEISKEAGIHGSGLNFGLSASISDLNNDNWPDIYVTNDYDEQDFCYINNRNGTFTEVSHTIFNHLTKNGMGSDIADINNDGLPEIIVSDMYPEDNYRQKLLKGPVNFDGYQLSVDSGFHHQYMRNTLQLNLGFAADGLPRFSEVGQLAGISNTDWSWTTNFIDFDNDGLKDLFITNGFLKDLTDLDFLKLVEIASKGYGSNNPLDLIKYMNTTKISNYCFSNTNGIQFKNVTEEWGLGVKTITNSAAFADLDNDGDVDMVFNNLNDEAMVFQNNLQKANSNHFIKLKLKGAHKNSFGIGSKIRVELDKDTLYHEAYYTRGFLSSQEPVLTIGIGNHTLVNRIVVVWPDDQISTLTNIESNQTIVIDQHDAGGSGEFLTPPPASLFKDVTHESGLDFVHVENEFNDFHLQNTLLYQPSRLGGKMAVGDVNSDGNDDVFLCGAANQSSALYFGQDDGTLAMSNSQPWQLEKRQEDIDAIFFDADGDNDLDLYVVSGGSEFPKDSPNYQDRFYVNDGKGNFELIPEALPAEFAGGGCVAAGDFDQDGDLDLFVGGRMVPGEYPQTPNSYLLRNDTENGKVKFRDATPEANKDLASVGMVTDARWTDINNDGWVDLMVVGEWMPVRLFLNENGKLKDYSAPAGLENTEGWWTMIFEDDVDGDGDIDFMLGNAGTNLQIQAKVNEPLTFYLQDIDGNGSIDPILAHYVQGVEYPLARRDELIAQVGMMADVFSGYRQYANTTMPELMSKINTGDQKILPTRILASSCLINNGDGTFRCQPLPLEAQFSMVNGVVKEDFDRDGSPEFLLAGNFYAYNAFLGRSDASTGVLTEWKNGGFKVKRQESPLLNSDDVRDLTVLKFKHTPYKIVTSANNGAAKVYEIRE